MNTVIIETIVSIVSNLVITLIGVAGAWLVMQIGKHQELKTINAAVGEPTTAAETTVQELNQTVVEGLKEASAAAVSSPRRYDRGFALLIGERVVKKRRINTNA